MFFCVPYFLNYDSYSLSCIVVLQSTFHNHMVHFLRHAQTDFNVKKDLNSKDIGINDVGVKQCKDLKILNTYDIVVCSPMNRCKQTLKECGIHPKEELIYSHLCREHKLHNCDFLQGEDVSQVETEKELLDRVSQFKLFLRSFNDKSVLVVTHGDFIWYFTSKVVENERFGQWADNCQIVAWPDEI